MPLSEWKLRNSSSRFAASVRALADRLLEHEQRPADDREMLLSLGEVVVEEAVEELGHRAPWNGGRSTLTRFGQQGLRRERLGQVSGRARLHRGGARLVVVASGEHDDREVSKFLVGSHEAQHLQPVHVGHVQVEHDQVDRRERELFDGFEPRRGLDDLHRERRQRSSHHAADGRRVVDDKEVWHLLRG